MFLLSFYVAFKVFKLTSCSFDVLLSQRFFFLHSIVKCLVSAQFECCKEQCLRFFDHGFISILVYFQIIAIFSTDQQLAREEACGRRSRISRVISCHVLHMFTGCILHMRELVLFFMSSKLNICNTFTYIIQTTNAVDLRI